MLPDENSKSPDYWKSPGWQCLCNSLAPEAQMIAACAFEGTI